jgi:hypothetical protein
MAPPISASAPSEINLLAGLCSDDALVQKSALETILAQHISLDALIQLAARHQVSPLLYRSIKRQESQQPVLSELQRATLRQTCRNITMHNLRLETELIRISSVLDHAGIPHLTFKGPVLARYAFGDLGLREFNDFDLLTSEKDILRIMEVMSNAGYQPIVTLNGIQRKKLQHFEKEITYLRPESGQRRFEADVHWMLLRPALKVPLTFEMLWKHAREVNLGDRKCHTLDETYTFIATCIHNGGNEVWHNLKQVADLHAVMRRWSPWSVAGSRK